MIPIDDPDDPRVEPYRRVRERDLAGRSGLFVAEGEVVVRMLLSDRARFRANSLLLADGRAGGLADLARTVRPQLPVFLAGRAVMDRIVGFPIHRGVLALGERGPPGLAEALLARGGRALVVVAVGLANHDNVGGLFRNAAAFGASAVLIDRESCDPLYRKAIRVSAGAALTVPFARGGDAPNLLAAVTRAGFQAFALAPGGRERLDRVVWPDRTALVVGSEGHGLPPEMLTAARTVRIDMVPGFDSLNVATAAAIAMHAVGLPRD